MFTMVAVRDLCFHRGFIAAALISALCGNLLGCATSRVTNPPPGRTVPGYSRLPRQPADGAERLRAVFEDETRNFHPSRYQEVYLPGGHEAVLRIKVRSNGHVKILRVLSSTHPVSTRVCKRFLRESIFEPALDLEGRAKGFELSFVCEVSFGGIAFRW